MNLWSVWCEGEGELRSAWISCFPGAALLPSTQRWLCGPVMVALAMVPVVMAVLTVITVIAAIAVLGGIAVLAVIDRSPCCDGGCCVDGGPHCNRGRCGDGGPCHDPSCVRRGPRRAQPWAVCSGWHSGCAVPRAGALGLWGRWHLTWLSECCLDPAEGGSPLKCCFPPAVNLSCAAVRCTLRLFLPALQTR